VLHVTIYIIVVADLSTLLHRDMFALKNLLYKVDFAYCNRA